MRNKKQKGFEKKQAKQKQIKFVTKIQQIQSENFNQCAKENQFILEYKRGVQQNKDYHYCSIPILTRVSFEPQIESRSKSERQLSWEEHQEPSLHSISKSIKRDSNHCGMRAKVEDSQNIEGSQIIQFDQIKIPLKEIKSSLPKRISQSGMLSDLFYIQGDEDLSARREENMLKLQQKWSRFWQQQNNPDNDSKCVKINLNNDKRFCHICFVAFENYYSHIFGEEHRKKVRKSPCQKLIKDIADKYKKKRSLSPKPKNKRQIMEDKNRKRNCEKKSSKVDQQRKRVQNRKGILDGALNQQSVKDKNDAHQLLKKQIKAANFQKSYFQTVKTETKHSANPKCEKKGKKGCEKK